MTAQYRAPLPCPPDVRHIARQSLAEAMSLLERGPLSDRAVHAVRKELKRARAMLRLMRAALGENAYQRDNAAMRDVARALGEVRDSKVLLDTLQSLPTRTPVTVDRSRAELRTRLRRERERSRAALGGNGTSLRRSQKSLRSVRHSLSRGPADRYDWRVLRQGVRRVYGRARTTLGRVRAHRAAEDLHELRKQTKYLWHQLEAFATSDGGGARSLAAATHRLSDLLGDEHNLTVLRGKVLQASLAPSAQKRLLARIDARRERLIGRALVLARRIFRDPPRAFAARVTAGPR